MNTRELNFAYKVRHALNESAENLPTATVDRLAAARKAALSRRKKESPLRALIPQRALAGEAGSFLEAPLTWLSKMGLALPLVVVALGIAGIYQFEQQRRINDLAEIDTAVLSDDLPLSAYVDHGFNAFLANRGE
ncbi:DUF3619 family protein [Noviherbaspirillum galbum]|uniref:DUF3619 family protein n=1 Tax=Noviherbaspirillum galbum TaxID=2709383 RepID=A0A6B3SSL7_9BURK|nr:DUF3619 family protein [Noviherbaspirillum galbum]NEX61826.1 DUF3619 family protein [Noviherbaspirillum galbum]